MKNRAMRWVVYTTALLVIVTILSSYNALFKWVFSLMVIGQAALIFMVYQVLVDKYKTDLTFKDGYQDHRILLKGADD